MKKILKNPLIIILLGVIIFTSVSVSAYSLFANRINYTPSDSSFKKQDGTNIENVSEAIDELYKIGSEVTPLDLSLNGIIMGKSVNRTEIEPYIINDLSKYKKLKITCSDNVDYIDTYVYIDNELVLTISDSSEHVITINNNNTLKVRLVAKSTLGLGGINIRIKAE